MYTIGTITYNTLPISKKSNIWFSIWTRKKLLHRLPNSTGGRPLSSLSKEVDFIGQKYGLPISNWKKNQKMQRMQYKHMNHSARGVVCERSHARHIFNRVKKEGSGESIRYWYESAINVISRNCIQRCVIPLTWETVPFNLNICAYYDNTITLITREKSLHL